jgi:Cu-processing system permease protein
MRQLLLIARATMKDVVRSRWLLFYGLFFFGVTDLLIRVGGADEKVVLSLINVMLFVTPLMTIVLATVYTYDSRRFVELLLSQPVRRTYLYLGLYAGFTLPLVGVLALALGVPLLSQPGIREALAGNVATLIGGGVALTLVFSALAFVVGTVVRERMRGLATAVAIWLFFAVVYDGAVLLLVALLGDHPLEKPLLAMMAANPIDLVRVAMLLRFDIAALLGYTGTVLQKVFSGSAGLAICTAAVCAWTAALVSGGVRAFARKDF